MNRRIPYYDTIRLLAIFWVYTTHFIARFDSDLFRFWSEKPTSLLLEGLTGKAAVAMFAVILGYFASAPSKKEISTGHYLIKRYLYFVICGLVINSLYAVFGPLGVIEADPSLLDVIKTSLMIGDEIFPTYWCMPAFLYGSVLCFINSKYGLGVMEVAVQALILILLGCTWVPICLFGNILSLLLREDRLSRYLKNGWLQATLLVAVFFLVKHSESTVTYLVDGLCSVLLLLIIAYNAPVQNVLNHKFLAGLGKNCMAIYLIHPLVYNAAGPGLFQLLAAVPYRFRFPAVWLLCFALIVLCSYPVMAVINWSNGKVSKGISCLFAQAA
ncbi:MAG: acyltransferase [Oscillospiraceae bacterium]|nr:acyltransferase [Oscillospiraceae bacterium]